MPRRLFDAHLHIIDPAFPLRENDGFLPDPFRVSDYRRRVDGLGIEGGAVVSGSFQAFDQGYLLAALDALGAAYVGVTQVPADVSDAQILALDTAGVRAVRFNAHRGGSADLDELDRLARRVHDVAGWHTELYIDVRELHEIADRVRALPAVTVDHLGLHAEGLPALLALVEAGVRVKATGFGRVDLDPAAAVAAIMDVDPTALMFGTDLPSTRARRPFSDQDIDLLVDVLDPSHVDAVLWRNAADLYLRRLRAA
jgi:predicted TIM-barrel fold metal-dependent hydrolase